MMSKQKLRELAQKATPGEWIVGECYADNGAGTYCGIYNSDGRDVYSEDGISEPDAEYIAAANPATILALLDENAALLEALKEARTWIRMRVDDDETRCLTSPNHESDRLEQIARLRGKLSGLRAARNIGGLTPDQLQKIDDLSAATMGFLRRAHQRPHS